MEVATYFFIALVLSFLGSLPLGLITLTITQRTMEKGRKSGVLLALGATVMEFVYTYIALISLDLFTQNTSIGQYIQYAATLVFFILGFYFLFKKSQDITPPASTYNYFDFFRGVVVGAMNMLIVPFWIFLAIWLESQGYFFDRATNIFSFSVGSALGALLAFLGYISLSEWIMGKIKTIHRYTDTVVGILFLGLGIFQLFNF